MVEEAKVDVPAVSVPKLPYVAAKYVVKKLVVVAYSANNRVAVALSANESVVEALQKVEVPEVSVEKSP